MKRRPPQLLVMVLAALIALQGCSSSSSTNPYTSQNEGARNSAKAQHLTMEAAEHMADDPEKAERLLREALAADLWHGPAHNNLGVILLKREAWYEAAGEFEWARKLMPGHPDPRMNLALTLEKAGRVDEALATYQTALEVYPGHIPTIQALTRLQLRSRQPDNRTQGFLREIALAGETQHWRAWAQERLALEPNANASAPASLPASSPAMP